MIECFSGDEDGQGHGILSIESGCSLRSDDHGCPDNDINGWYEKPEVGDSLKVVDVHKVSFELIINGSSIILVKKIERT